MEKLSEITSIKPTNPNKLVRENRDKINELVSHIATLENTVRGLRRAIATGGEMIQ